MCGGLTAPPGGALQARHLMASEVANAQGRKGTCGRDWAPPGGRHVVQRDRVCGCRRINYNGAMETEVDSTSPLIRHITAENLLSFGPRPQELSIELGPLNVLIGPNGSGKSNLLEAIGLLAAAPAELSRPIRSGGGTRNWIWRRMPDVTAAVGAVVDYPNGRQPLRHTLEFKESNQLFRLVDERVENEEPDTGHSEPYFFYKFQRGRPVIAVKGEDRPLRFEDIATDESILSQREDPDQFPELAHLRRSYRAISLYRNWPMGRSSGYRQPQDTDVRQSPLAENLNNLGMFLNRLRQDPRTKATLVSRLSDAYEDLSDFELNFQGGTVEIFFTERDLAVPASRLSDGSLRYLSLIALLSDPDPPLLIGIEEPEMGIHPDLLPKIADLMVEASQRCQLVVTTHSDVLVDALTDHPEAVVVCEKHEGRTAMARLDRTDLSEWLKKYHLGELWTSGELGGVRW